MSCGAAVLNRHRGARSGNGSVATGADYFIDYHTGNAHVQATRPTTGDVIAERTKRHRTANRTSNTTTRTANLVWHLRASGLGKYVDRGRAVAARRP